MKTYDFLLAFLSNNKSYLVLFPSYLWKIFSPLLYVKLPLWGSLVLL